MFALVDGNNFYASCERVFNPSLRAKPLIVLSNNDGCAIARSAEAKALGVRMGHPAHELKHLVRDHGLIMRSANFALYGDMSGRVVQILTAAAPRVEIYSIDESFLDLTGVRQAQQFAFALRDKIHRWTGIPNCIGLGPTKTLAKLANKVAKEGRGVVDITDPAARAATLESFPVADLWGVGRRWAARLAEMGIHTAAQLRDAPPDDLMSSFGVVLARTQRELQGHSCMDLEEVEPDRKQIVVSRSFGNRVEDHDSVRQALSTFAERACEKLRRRGLVAAAVQVFAHTDPFRPELPQHHPNRATKLPTATADTRAVVSVVRILSEGLFRKGMGYKKAGVMLLDLARPEHLQSDLFKPAVVGDERLMRTLDRINEKYGRGTAGLGATGWQVKPEWRMRQLQLSPSYTTSVRELPRALC